MDIPQGLHRARWPRVRPGRVKPAARPWTSGLHETVEVVLFDGSLASPIHPHPETGWRAARTLGLDDVRGVLKPCRILGAIQGTRGSDVPNYVDTSLNAWKR